MASSRVMILTSSGLVESALPCIWICPNRKEWTRRSSDIEHEVRWLVRLEGRLLQAPPPRRAPPARRQIEPQQLILSRSRDLQSADRRPEGQPPFGEDWALDTVVPRRREERHRNSGESSAVSADRCHEPTARMQCLIAGTDPYICSKVSVQTYIMGTLEASPERR
ncbi:uncharacterized protein MYCGRDRAFT_94211 [Zymoseptoria tritici IPO323]|uniref:Uncharacterized protein n=1 Tax=Zymoseptoria tritici (strain CBS 115943 / IPO323) TaxID=336722 RepID=F9XGC8_ZYMTI|nr:uncharacterized protein MYCGRDRAFT_94211 [Zymoseptoria tritici IPO323]EGP86288.1 hypothetical protein MYCGRDRAFT_94211 [Zymoseptoria tritici IPO323]